jgi:hypothetical protein
MPSSKEYWLHAQQCLELAKEAEDFYVKSALFPFGCEAGTVQWEVERTEGGDPPFSTVQR